MIGLIPVSKIIELRFFFDSYSDALAAINSLGGLHLEHDEMETVTNENLYIPFAHSSRQWSRHRSGASSARKQSSSSLVG